MRNKLKRFISALIATVMLFSMVPNVFGSAADQFVDFPTGWSKPAMESAVANGLLTGYENNEIRPTANLTRAEFAAIISRAFGAKTVADISRYSDVSKDDWYYDYIAKVVKMGAMNGVSNTSMNPEANITREEVFTAVARVLVLSDADISGFSKFKDSAKVSSWAQNSMSALAKRGYVNGDDLGNANPGANITREEFAQFMYNAIRTYITKSGTYDKDMEGIVVLRTGDVELKNLSITSDLVIGDGVLEDSVKITNVKVEKRLLTRGGTITVKNTTLGGNVVVNNVNGITYFKNYRDEKVFKGIVENTEAKFLTRSTGGGGGGVSTITVSVDGETKTFNTGTTIDALPKDKLGYTFVEWRDGSGNPIAPGTVLTNGMVIVFFGTPIDYPINYLAPDGTAFLDAWFTDPTMVPRSFNIENQDQDSKKLPVATQIYRMGYKFINWFDGATAITKPQVKVGMNTTDGLRVKATMETLNYTVSYKHKGQDIGFNVSVPQNFTVETMAGLSLPSAGDFNIPGYTFNGWKHNGNTISSFAGIDFRALYDLDTTQVVIEADMIPITYGITYMVNGSPMSIGGTSPISTDFTVVDIEENTIVLPGLSDVNETGYTFEKWLYNGSEFNLGSFSALDLDTIDPSVGLVLEADLKLNEYSIAYKYKGNDVTFKSSANIPPILTIENAATLGLPVADDLNMKGYTFKGWSYKKEGVSYAVSSFEDIDIASLNTTDGLVLEADLEPITYDIVYMVNGNPMSIGGISSISTDFTVVDIEENTIVLPGLSDVNETGYTFEKWLYNGSEFNLGSFSALDLDTIDPSVGLVLEADLKLNEYSIAYKYKGNDVTFKSSANIPPILTIENAATLGLPGADALDMKGYTFKGWSYKKAGVSYAVAYFSDIDIASLNTTDGLVLEADLEPIPYNIAYRGLVDGKTEVFYDKWIPNVTKETEFTVEDPYTLPLANEFKRAGYTFVGWVDKNGTSISEVNIDNITGNETTVTVYAKFSMNTYKVEFNAEFTDGTTQKTIEYNAKNYKDVKFEDMSDLVKLEVGQYFGYWHLLGDENSEVEVLTEDHLFDTDGAVLQLEAKITDSLPLKIRFFKGYTSNESELIYTKTLFLEEDSGKYYYTYDESDFVTEVDNPMKESSTYRELLFDKSVYVPQHYTTGGRVYVKPDFRFEKDGKLTSFYSFFDLKDGTGKKYARIEGDPLATAVDPIDVYLTYQQFKIRLTLDGTALSISTPYGLDSRIMDSSKRLGVSSKEQLEVFRGIRPEIYNKIKDAAIDKLIATKLVDEDLNIKILNLDLPISRFISKTTVNGMVKKYVRQTMTDKNKLETVLGMADIDALIDSIGKDTLIERLSDAQIVSLMKENKGTLQTFIKDDLSSAEPVLLDAVAEFISNDADFKADLVSQIVAELKKDIDAESELRDIVVYEILNTGSVQSSVANILVGDIQTGNVDDDVVDYIKNSDFLKDWIISDLNSATSTLMPTVVGYISGVIDDDTDQGKDLRLELMKSNFMAEVLTNGTVKTAIINLLVDDLTILSAALDNADFKKLLIDEAVKNETFVKYMIASDEFEKEIIIAVRWLDLDDDGIWEDQASELDKKGFLHDALVAELSDEEFLEMIDKKFQEVDAFKALLEDGGSLRQTALDAITLQDYIVSEDDLLKYILNQGNCSDYSEIITQSEIETYLCDTYEEYRLAGDAEKQLVKDNIYNDAAEHASIIAKIETEFEDYKVTVLNDFVAGNAIPGDVLNAVNAELVEYIKDYLTGLNDDDSIKDLIVMLVREFIEKDESEFTPGTHLAEFKAYVDAEKENYLNSLSDMTASEIKPIVESFMAVDTNKTAMNTVITDCYSAMTDELEAVIKQIAEAKGAAYETLDDMLIANLQNVSLDTYITGYIKDLTGAQDKTDAKELIKKAIDSGAVTNAQIKTELQKYAAVDGNIDTLKTNLVSYITGMEEAEVKELLKTLTNNKEAKVREILASVVDNMSLDDIKKYAKKYINDDANSDEIDGYISKFIDDVDEDFVNANRETINNALSGVDIVEYATVDFIMSYIEELSDPEKEDIADDIYAQVSTTPEYTKLIDEMLGSETFTIDESNLFMVQLLAEGIKNLTFDDVLGYQSDDRIEKLINAFGRSFIEGKYNDSKEAYTDGLDKKISIVSNDKTKVETYTTKLTVRMNLIREIIIPLYDKALPEVIEKLEALPIKYSQNEHLQYLAEHDALSHLLSGSGIESADLSGYAVKDEMEIADYMLGLFMVADDAICWYGDDSNVTETEFNAVYDAMFDRAQKVKDKLDSVLAAYEENGEIPEQAQKLLDSVSQINNLYLKLKPTLVNVIEKYFENNVDDKTDPSEIEDNAKFKYALDVFFGQEEPVFTIDTLYAIFFAFDDDVQAKLKSALDSGKLQAAVDKFEATPVGKIFKGKGTDRIITVLENIAESGVDPYKVNTAGDLTIQDAYEVTVNGNTIRVERNYFFNN